MRVAIAEEREEMLGKEVGVMKEERGKEQRSRGKALHDELVDDRCLASNYSSPTLIRSFVDHSDGHQLMINTLQYVPRINLSTKEKMGECGW